LKKKFYPNPETHLLLWFQRSKKPSYKKRKKKRTLVNVLEEEILSQPETHLSA